MSVPSTLTSARMGCVRTCWGHTNAPAMKALRSICQAETVLVGKRLLCQLKPSYQKPVWGKSSRLSVCVFPQILMSVWWTGCCVTTVCAGTHQAASPVSVPKDTSLTLSQTSAKVRDSFILYNVTSSLHISLIRDGQQLLFCLSQMWMSACPAPVLMESVRTAEGPLCVCVQSAARWTALGWSV